MPRKAESSERSPVEDLQPGDHRIRYLRPAPGLESFVRCYAHRSCRVLEGAVVHPVHARAAPVIEFVLGGQIDVTYCDGRRTQPSPSPNLVGVHTGRRAQLLIRGNADSFVILFRPAALHRLFSLPMHELTDLQLDARSVLGPSLGELEQRLGNCRTFDGRASIVNDFLLGRALETGAVDGVSAAAEQMIHGVGTVKTAELAHQAGLSLRQFERRFNRQIGMGPKMFARVVRFEAAMDCMTRSNADSWTDLAYRFGYFDQMHMVHEFAALADDTPTRMLNVFRGFFRAELDAVRHGLDPGNALHCSRIIL
jgi:AraC-like DNA-binding protein